MYPKVSVIILNWNGWEDTIECLESLYQVDYPNYDVVLVDNNSEDDSLQMVRDYCKGIITPESKFYSYKTDNKPIKYVKYDEDDLKHITWEDKKNHNPASKLTIIQNNDNYGFAKGNNIGIEYALSCLKPDYVLLLNNDTVVTQEFLLKLVNTAEEDELIGIVGPKILKYHNTEIIDSTGHTLINGRILDRGHEELDNGQYDKNKVVIGAIAACSLYKNNMLHEIGLFDESFFMVYEDAELSWRAYKNGWKAEYVPESIIYHKRGKSITKKSVNSRMILLNLRNMVKTTEKYGTNKQKFLFSFVILSDGVYILKERFFGRNNVNILEYVFLVFKSYFKIIFSSLKDFF